MDTRYMPAFASLLRMEIIVYAKELQTSISVLQSQADFNDLYTELIIEIPNTKHLRPESFSSCEEKGETFQLC